jgi:hypothetical protein
MIELSQRRRQPEPDERRIIALEFAAACSLICIFAVVLFIIFTYRPV